MRYLLDSNVVIKLLVGNAGIMARVHEHGVEDIGISAIAAYELFYGAGKSDRVEHNTARLQGLRFPIVDFDAAAAIASANVRVALSRAGALIGPYDLLIAGQALARRLVLVTHNTREFRRVSGLQLEDWQS